MNNLQKLFSCISGFELNSPFTFAKDDYYYELVDNKASHKDRINHLMNYGNEYVGLLTPHECAIVDKALREDMAINNSNDRDHLYLSLI
jgi:hypothetical protein